jgi:uncharacterized protein
MAKKTFSLLLLAASSNLFAAPFVPADTNFIGNTYTLAPAPVQSVILMRATVDTATNKNGQKAVTKTESDFIGYVPINGRSDSGYVIVNHETAANNDFHGDGGGMTVFTAQFKNNSWSVAPHPAGNYRSVDFTPVGGTLANCGGGQTPWGTVLTGEEWIPTSNSNLRSSNGFRDTADWLIPVYNGDVINRSIKRFQNMNWIVEVDAANAVALKKHYNMGRYAHEVGYPLSDGKTVFLTDDATPAVFFKFVSDTVGNYNKGQLYAYRQSGDGESGTWVPMPMSLDSMIDVRAMAFRRGASAFTRHEWVVEVDGKLYITETGNDNSGTAHRNAVRTGANLPRHLAQRQNSDSSIVDYFGRILRLDLTTNKLDVYLEGGAGTTGAIHLSNPDGLTAVTLGDKKYLVIQEDIIGRTQGRVSAAANSAGRNICEMYWLEITPGPSSLDSLKRMLVGTAGSEITGARFTPDGRTMFVNLQHPSSSLAAPYNRALTLAIWGYETPTGLIFDAPAFKKSDRLQVEVNRMSGFAYFDRVSDVELFNAAGRRLERHRGVRMVDVSHLNSGSYFLRFKGGESHPLVLQ